uniref:Uncharacterized protein n=1 Tax=Echinococcus granulosus TaxID=6210 RepID=U6FU71_ECHGR|nr:hypothetical protein EgrG_002071200 [Echinococcus granulosus]
MDKEGDFNFNLEQISEEDQFGDSVKMIFWFWDNSDDDKDATDGDHKDDDGDRYDKDIEDGFDGDATTTDMMEVTKRPKWAWAPYRKRGGLLSYCLM